MKYLLNLKKYTLAALLLCGFMGHSQPQAPVDSVFNYIEALTISDAKSALKQSKQLQNELLVAKDSSSLAKAYLIEANAYLRLNNFENAEIAINRALQIGNNKSYLENRITQTSAIIAYKKGEAYRSLKLFKQVVNNITETNQSDFAESYYYLADLQLMLDKDQQALANARKGLSLAKAGNRNKFIGRSYNLLASINVKLNDDRRVEAYLENARAVNKAYGSVREVARTGMIASKLSLSDDKPQMALQENKSALRLVDRDTTSRIFNELLLQQSEIWQHLDSLDLSESYALRALKNMERSKQSATYRSIVLAQLSQVQIAKGDSAQALSNFLQSRAIVDSLQKIDISKMLLQDELLREEAKTVKLAAESKRKDILLQRSKLYLIGAAVVILVVVLILVGVWQRTQRKKRFDQLVQERKTTEAKKNEEIGDLMQELKQKNEELLDLDKAKTKVLSVLTHDMRQPINQIRSVLELLENDQLSEVDRKEVVHQLKQSVNSSSNALENLLLWSKKQLKGIKTNVVDVHLLPQVWQLEGHLKPSLDQKNIKLTINVPDFMKIKADMNQLDICLKNLVTNAVKFSEHGGEIKINAYSEGDFDIVEIQDFGVGMTEEQLEKINSDAGFTTLGTMQEKGTGLGILITKDYMQEQGGELKVESEKNRGTTFKMRFPVKNSKLKRNNSLTT